mgnify:CR=1 FL=1
MKKAFTLIELLAVIIVLAVVALIATPLVLDVVEEVRDEARIGGSEPLSGSRCLARIEQRNKFSVGDTIEIMKPDGTNRMTEVLAMYNGEMEPVGSCPHSKQVIWLELSQAPERYDLLRVENTR